MNDVPGVFTGSGMPMRFAKADGTMIDVYQATTQMTDESGQSYPFTVDTLLDRALGPQGYYGAFVANMHTDTAAHAGSEAIVASAQARGVPVISASRCSSGSTAATDRRSAAFSWNGATLTFSVSVEHRSQRPAGHAADQPGLANPRHPQSERRDHFIRGGNHQGRRLRAVRLCQRATTPPTTPPTPRRR